MVIVEVSADEDGESECAQEDGDGGQRGARPTAMARYIRGEGDPGRAGSEPKAPPVAHERDHANHEPKCKDERLEHRELELGSLARSPTHEAQKASQGAP
jgi:hypothetical protein